MKRNYIIPFLFAFFYSKNICVAQKANFIGKAEYVIESLLPSGNYKENIKTISYFNEIGYCVKQNEGKIDVDAMVTNQLKKVVQSYNAEYNKHPQSVAPLDSFAIERERKKIKANIEEALSKKSPTPFTYINYNASISTMPVKIDGQLYCVADSLSKNEWVLLNDTITLEGLLCQKAEGQHNGKLYTVWFAPSVPFAAGPLGMHGLPGIIVSATSNDKKRKYQLIRLEYPLSNSVELVKCGDENEKTVSKPEFIKIQENYKNEQQKKREELMKNKQ